MHRIAPSMIFTLLTCPVAFISQSALADECATGRCLGPNSPVMMDMSADGTPDTAIPIKVIDGSVIVIDSPWACNPESKANRLYGSKSDYYGKYYDSFGRSNGHLDQVLTVVDVVDSTPAGGGGLKTAEFNQISTQGEKPVPTATGSVALEDNNQDGGFETIVMQQSLGGNLAITTNIAGIDTTGDGNADYATLPWAYAAAFHNPNNGCGPNEGKTLPQISFPLTDTNGDGKPDRVVLDLDGDNTADPDFMRSPMLQTVPNEPPYSLPAAAPAATAIPTLTQMALLILSLALAAIGWASVRRNIIG